MIKPVVGDAISGNFSVALSNTSLFLFKYLAGDFQRGNITHPVLGLILDSANETRFALNPVTGIAGFYAYIANGLHSVYLKLYDGTVLKAHSDPNNKVRLVIGGQDMVINLIPFYTLVTFKLNQDGGKANFDFNFPADIVQALGGVDQNLQVTLTLSGARSGVHDYPVTLVPSNQGNGTYAAHIMADDIHYEPITWALSFYDMEVVQIGRAHV